MDIAIASSDGPDGVANGTLLFDYVDDDLGTVQVGSIGCVHAG